GRRITMFRALLCSLAVLMVVSVAAARADDAKAKNEKDKHMATIAKVDAKNGTIEVKMRDANGKKVDQTLHLADKATYLDSKGKPAKLESFHQGDRVCLTEK